MRLVLEIWRYIPKANRAIMTFNSSFFWLKSVNCNWFQIMYWKDFAPQFVFVRCNITYIYTPHFSEVERGGILVSRRPSVCPWTESCPLRNFHNDSWIHFIFTHLIKQLMKRCRVYRVFFFLQNSKIRIFGKFFKLVTLTSSCFDLGSEMTQWYE